MPINAQCRRHHYVTTMSYDLQSQPQLVTSLLSLSLPPPSLWTMTPPGACSSLGRGRGSPTRWRGPRTPRLSLSPNPSSSPPSAQAPVCPPTARTLVVQNELSFWLGMVLEPIAPALFSFRPSLVPRGLGPPGRGGEAAPGVGRQGAPPAARRLAGAAGQRGAGTCPPALAPGFNGCWAPLNGKPRPGDIFCRRWVGICESRGPRLGTLGTGQAPIPPGPRPPWGRPRR